MIASRVGAAALRQGAAKPTGFFLQTLPKAALVAGMSTTPARNSVSGTPVSQEQGREILAAQRRNRPISPHLGIYKMEQTWFGTSAWTRITGCTLSGIMYAYMGGYLVAPLLGLHIESASIAATFASLPLAVKGAFKFGLAFPFAFHFLSGLKHLKYDVGSGFKKATIIKSEKIVWGLGVLGAIGLVAFL